VSPPATRRRPATVFFAALFAIILYLALCPYPLGREAVVRPAWAVTIPGPADPAASAAPAGGRPARFQLGGVFGYVDGGGRFFHVETTRYQVALADTGFVNYTRLAADWVLQDPVGTRVSSFSGAGYPLLAPDTGRAFVVKSDLSGLTGVDDSGEAAWSRDFPSLLTSVSVRGTLLLAGLLDGSLQVLGPDGAAVFAGAPAPGRIPVILGTALAGDGSRAAVISGIDPQSLTVYARRGTGFVEESRQLLASDFRREVRIELAPGGRLAAFEGPSGAALYDPRARRLAALPLSGILQGIAFPGQGRFAAFVGGPPAGRERLVVVDPFVGTVFSAAFEARALGVGTIDGELLLGMDGRLLRLDVERL
jgi:hypothetical protein